LRHLLGAGEDRFERLAGLVVLGQAVDQLEDQRLLGRGADDVRELLAGALFEPRV
jgi:hypothetical protein